MRQKQTNKQTNKQLLSILSLFIAIAVLSSCENSKVNKSPISINSIESEFGIDIKVPEQQIISKHGSLENFRSFIIKNSNKRLNKVSWQAIARTTRTSTETIIKNAKRQGFSNAYDYHIYLLNSHKSTYRPLKLKMGAYRVIADTPDGFCTIVYIKDDFIVDAFEENGYSLPYSCRAGACGACAGKITEGAIIDEGMYWDENQMAAGFFHTCVSIPKTDMCFLSHQESEAHACNTKIN